MLKIAYKDGSEQTVWPSAWGIAAEYFWFRCSVRKQEFRIPFNTIKQIGAPA